MPGDGIYPSEGLEAAARKLSRRFVGFDALTAARQHQTEVNALLLGALSATGVLPMTAADFEAAIREGGVAVERNMRGLKAGQELVAAGQAGTEAPPAERPWPAVKAERAAALGSRGAAFLALAARTEAEFPDSLHRDPGRSARAPDRLPGRPLRGAVPRARPAGPRARPGRAADARLRAAARGVDDLRGRHPRGRPQDAPRPLRAHPPRERGARGLGRRGHGLPQARPRRALRHPARRDRRAHRALGGAAVARRPPDDRPAREDHLGAGLPARLAARPPSRAAPVVAAPPARVRADEPVGGRGARRPPRSTRPWPPRWRSWPIS